MFLPASSREHLQTILLRIPAPLTSQDLLRRACSYNRSRIPTMRQATLEGFSTELQLQVLALAQERVLRLHPHHVACNSLRSKGSSLQRSKSAPASSSLQHLITRSMSRTHRSNPLSLMSHTPPASNPQSIPVRTSPCTPTTVCTDITVHPPPSHSDTDSSTLRPSHSSSVHSKHQRWARLVEAGNLSKAYNLHTSSPVTSLLSSQVCHTVNLR